MLDAGLLSTLHWKIADSDSLTVLLLCISNLRSEGNGDMGMANKTIDFYVLCKLVNKAK
jgi:hypothetical protein